MRIPATRVERQFHIKFSRSETAYLRDIGFLHPECAIESEMWMNEKDFELLYDFPCFNKEELTRLLNEAKEKIARG